MELTPQQFIEAEFTEVRRGFDRDEVDAFLVKAAKGVEALQKRVAELQAQLDARPPDVPTDDMIARTLKLAQRTADEVTAQAQSDADALRATATQEADAARSEASLEASRTLDDAHVRAAQVLAEAEAEARAASEELRARLRAEVVALEDARNRLRSEANMLEEHVRARRERLVTTADDLRALANEHLARAELPDAQDIELPDETPVLQFHPRDVTSDPVGLDDVPDLAPDEQTSTSAATIAAALAPPPHGATPRLYADGSTPAAREAMTDHADGADGATGGARAQTVGPAVDPDPTPSNGMPRIGADEELVRSFFDEAESFKDERWKKRHERER